MSLRRDPHLSAAWPRRTWPRASRACRAAGRRRPPRGAADAPLSGSDIYSHFASLIVPTPVTRDPDTGTQLRPRRVAVLRAPLRATSGRGGRAQTSARGAHRVSQGPGDAFVHSVPTGSPPPGSSLTPPGVPGIQIHQRGSSSDPTEDLLRVPLDCLEGGFCQAEGARTGWARGPQGRERASG